MPKAPLLLLLGLALATALKFEARCGPDAPPSQTGPAEAPPFPSIALPANYQIDVLYTTSGNESAVFHEEFFEGSFTFSKLNHTGKYLLLNRTDGKIFAEEKAYSKVDKFPALFELPKQALTFFNLSDVSLIGELISSIVSKAKSKEFKNTTLFSTEPVGGIPAVHWVGCSSEAEEYFQVEVAYGDRAPPPPSGRINNPVILSFEISTYTVADNKTQLTQRVSFQVTFIDTIDLASVKKSQMVPRGTYIKNMIEAELPINLPSKFDINLHYVDTDHQITDFVEMLYDSVRRIVMFTVDKKDTDLAVFGPAVLESSWNKVDVVHDFNYGLQYALSPDGSICYEVAPINPGFGDVKKTDGQKLDLKPAKELILALTGSTFYHDGEVTSDAGERLDKFVSLLTRDNSSSVVEVFFTKGWKVAGKGEDEPVLHSVTHYHNDPKTLRMTTIKLEKLTDRSNLGTPWTRKNAFPCLSFTKSSYFYVKIASSSLNDLKNIGLDQVGSTLVETLADAANVSVLRFAEPYYEEDNNAVFVYFALSNPSGKSPADTVDRKVELPLLNATAALNTTLSTKGLSFTVTTDKGKHTLNLMKNEFGHVPAGQPPAPVPPPEPFKGYSGGSMFVLGLFAFLFGALASVGGLVVYWRSSRGRLAGGNVYQVFE